MHDLYDVVLHLIEKLLPNGAEKHQLVEEVKAMQAGYVTQAGDEDAADVEPMQEKKAVSRHGGSK